MASCFLKFKSKKKTDAAPTYHLSQVAMLNRASTRPSMPHPKRRLESLEKKINDLTTLQADLDGMEEMAKEFAEIQAEVNTIKGDLAKKIGYSLAVQLINELSESHGPNVEKFIPRATSNPWGWLIRDQDFKKLTLQNSDAFPEGMKSVGDIASKAAKITAYHTGKNHKGCPEKIYLELKSFKERGYMEALNTADKELHGFLSISELVGDHFIAGPRILLLMTHMLLRVKMQLGFFRQTKARKWEDRWQDIEAWFQIVFDCIGKINVDDLPKTAPELAKEFDSIEVSCRKIKAVYPAEAYSTERIVQSFKDVEESGLLTPEIKAKHLLSCTFLGCAIEIRDRYKALIADKKVKERLSTISEIAPEKTIRSSSITHPVLKLDCGVSQENDGFKGGKL